MSAELLRRAADKMRRDQRSKGRLSMTLRSVADWLEETAAWQDEGLGHVPGIELTNYPDAVQGLLDNALAVARAYLGETL